MKYVDAYIELVEEFEYEEKKQLTDREAYHIKNNPCVNKNIPGQTWQERWEKNKEHNVEKHKEWREAHKEELKEKRKVYDAENRDKLRADFKEWVNKNKEKRQAYMKEWREKNPDKVKAAEERRKKN